MPNANQLKQAQAVYKTMREMFDEKDFDYEADEENYSIFCGAQGDDLPMGIRMRVDPERMLIVSQSSMPFDTPENRRVEMAVAVSRANYGLPDGNFDFDIDSGDIVFRLTSCYRDSLVGKELFEYMLVVSYGIIEDYNDVFAKVAITDMSVEDIIKSIK